MSLLRSVVRLVLPQVDPVVPDGRGPVQALDGVAPVLEVLALQRLSHGLLEQLDRDVAGGVGAVLAQGAEVDLGAVG